MLELVEPQQHDAQPALRLVLDPGADGVLKFIFVEQAGHMVDLILFAQIGNESGEQPRLALFIPFQPATAAQPDPLAPGGSWPGIPRSGCRCVRRQSP